MCLPRWNPNYAIYSGFFDVCPLRAMQANTCHAPVVQRDAAKLPGKGRRARKPRRASPTCTPDLRPPPDLTDLYFQAPSDNREVMPTITLSHFPRRRTVRATSSSTKVYLTEAGCWWPSTPPWTPPAAGRCGRVWMPWTTARTLETAGTVEINIAFVVGAGEKVRDL